MIEIRRKLANGDMLVVNELANLKTLGEKVEMLKKALPKLTEEFSEQ